MNLWKHRRESVFPTRKLQCVNPPNPSPTEEPVCGRQRRYQWGSLHSTPSHTALDSRVRGPKRELQAPCVVTGGLPQGRRVLEAVKSPEEGGAVGNGHMECTCEDPVNGHMSAVTTRRGKVTA